MSDAGDNIEPKQRGGLVGRLLVLGIVLVVAAAVYWAFGDSLTLSALAERETQLRDWRTQHPVAVYAVAALVYVMVTGLSLPGATVLTLLYGWYFGLPRGVVLVSFASTAGATVAFLVSRFLFREAIERRFHERLQRFDAAWQSEGPFFLFALRLVPAVPFFVINAVMGLTSIRARTFWWVSQLGMLPGTIVYVYAGSSVPSLRTLADDGIGAVFSPTQLTRLVLAFALLGLLPLAARWTLKWFGRSPTGAQSSG
ncbi:MAG: TVP38/TMEM64 family protein [Planctomycetales bacterium]|nr:TVP38/TMEM64 family protein [Planctomycetales bacterium]